MLLALHVFVTFKSVLLSVLFGYYWFSYFDFKSLFLFKKRKKKMSQPGRRMYSMYARSDGYILRPQVRISSTSITTSL